MLEIYAIKIDQGKHVSDFERLLGYVDSDKQVSIKRFRMIDDANRALFGNLLIRYLICKKIGIRNEDIHFEKNEFGKPYLLNNVDFHFNISHSGGWIVCATDSMPVGIDVETIKTVDLKLAERFFSKIEFSFISSKKEADRLDHFIEIWTLKESYIKACGKGLSIPLDSFAIKIDSNNILIETENELKECFFKRYHIDNGYKMAVCSLQSIFPENVAIVSVDELSGFFSF
ncbi:MAG: 4'-phosphopantetheinyl transferase superfamily protein [Bacillota bacterium]|nr:4'-phosphopantetheinyl transferase superfamily protein [Bacillota bacterium]